MVKMMCKLKLICKKLKHAMTFETNKRDWRMEKMQNQSNEYV